MSSTATTKPRQTLTGRVLKIHRGIVNFLGWKVIIGTPIAIAVPWAGYYYVYYHRPMQLMRERRAIDPTAPPVRTTSVFTSGGDNGKDSETGEVSDAALANHSKIPVLEDPRKEVGKVDETPLGKLKFKVSVLVRGAQVMLFASPVIFLFIVAFLGLADFQRACTALHDLLCRLGPAFIKLGQWMATRPDLFPDEMCKTLSNLYDAAPAHSWEMTVEILSATRVSPNVRSRKLRSGDRRSSTTQEPTIVEPFAADEVEGTISILEALTDIEMEPLNSGSVAQVYKARLGTDMSGLKKGDEVAVKVLHPKVRDVIWKDVCVLKMACQVVNKFIPSGQYLDPMVHWYEFSSFLISQLNLDREADNLDQFRYNFRDFPLVEFPVPVRPLSGPDVLVESYERGYPLKKCSKVSMNLADRGVHIFLKMLFQDNFVHADLHPGNIFLRRRNLDDKIDPIRMNEDGTVGPDPLTLNELVILDPGLVTSLSPKDRENFILLFSSVACGDSDLAARLMVDRSPSHSCKDLEAFQKDMAKVFAIVTPETEQNKSLESGQKAFRLSEVRIGDVLMGSLMTLRKHKVAIDGNFATLMMSVIVGEGMGRAMNPDYNIFAAAAPFLIMSLKGSEIQQLVTQLQSKYGIGVVVDLMPKLY